MRWRRKSCSKAAAPSASNMSQNGQTSMARAGREVILSRRHHQLAAIAAALRHRPGRRCCGELGIPSCTTMPQVGANLQDHLGINYTMQGQGADAEPDAAAMVGQARGRHAISAAARRAAVDEHEPGRRLLPHRRVAQTRPNMQLYFQAVLDRHPASPASAPILTPDPWPGFSIGLSNCRPTSRGSI